VVYIRRRIHEEYPDAKIQILCELGYYHVLGDSSNEEERFFAFLQDCWDHCPDEVWGLQE
jgi:hypothetical protein